jgi:hypothetical protein
MLSTIANKKWALIATCLFVATFAQAGQLTSQAQLAGILGANETMENFEGNGLLPANVQILGNFLNSASTFGGYGPGLVQPGVNYSAGGSLYWNYDGYFGLNTRTLGDASAWRNDATTISYTEDVTAFGFDLSGYSGYDQSGNIAVYNTAGGLISDTAVNGGFFGWEDLGGIGEVVISATTGYIMIDNHGYGAAPAPEPLSLVALGLGVAALARKRRSK